MFKHILEVVCDGFIIVFGGMSLLFFIDILLHHSPSL